LLLVFSGVAVGVIVGAELFGSKMRPVLIGSDPTSLQTNATSFLSLGVGDPFPLIGFQDSLGQEFAPPQLLGGKGTILLFIGPECGACLDLLELWQNEAGMLRRKEVSVFACVPHRRDLSPEFEQLLAGHDVIYFDAARLAEKINLSFWPTTIGTDSNGKITFAVEGFSDDIVYRLAAWQSELK